MEGVIVEATINDVFYQDQSTPVELGDSKDKATKLDWQRFPLFPRMSVNITEGLDPSDGGTWQLRLSMLIDGIVMKGTTNWIPNTDDKRTRTYALEVDKHPVKLMQREKVHSVQFKLARRRMVFGVPVPIVSSWEDIAESDLKYYVIGKNPNLE
jgi:hypothetical protein